MHGNVAGHCDDNDSRTGDAGTRALRCRRAHRCARYPSRTRALRDRSWCTSTRGPAGRCMDSKDLIGWAVLSPGRAESLGHIRFPVRKRLRHPPPAPRGTPRPSDAGLLATTRDARRLRHHRRNLLRLSHPVLIRVLRPGVVRDSALADSRLARWPPRVSACARPVAAEIDGMVSGWWTGAAPAGDAGAGFGSRSKPRRNRAITSKYSPRAGPASRVRFPAPGVTCSRISTWRSSFSGFLPGSSPRARRADAPCKADYAMDDLRCSLVGGVMAPLAPPSGNPAPGAGWPLA